MANRPLRTTGCFRFVLFIMILGPLAYIGASYYNGQDGLQNVKNIINKVVGVFDTNKGNDGNVATAPNNTDFKQTKENSESRDNKVNTTTPPINNAELEAKVATKDKEINTLIQENLDLKSKLVECEKGKR